MNGPKKLGVIKSIRKISDPFLDSLPFPKINPNIVTSLALISAVLFVFSLKFSYLLALLFVLLNLLFDWLDGVIARKHRLETKKGAIFDLISDRTSEGIMFFSFFTPWFYFFILNSILLAVSFKIGKIITLPFRHAFAVYLIFVFLV